MSAAALAVPGVRRSVLLLSGGADPAPMIRLAVAAGTLPVSVETDAGVAVALAANRGAALVLADVRAGAALAELVSLPGAPVVVAAVAEVEADAICELLAAGVRAFVPLDGDPAELRRVIDSALAGESAVAESLASTIIGLLTARIRENGVERPVLARARVRERFTTLRPVFQPIMDLSSRRRLGYLALTRFANAEAAETADRFAEAREFGLDAELELAAAGAALDQLDRIGATDALFMKLSCRTVANPALESLLRPGRAPQVVLELTGHAALGVDDAFYSAVERLRARGVRFAVDETGAGFGALDHVLDLSPSFVRLAGGLTRGIHSDRTRRALALAVTSFATHLGARVIADRIESEDELVALRRLGVSYGLGFHLGRPVDLPPVPVPVPAQPNVPTLESANDIPSPLAKVLWPAPGLQLSVPPRTRRTFPDATRSVLRALADQLSPCIVYVSHIDTGAGAMRLVDVISTDRPPLEPGRSFRLDDAIDAAVFAGRAPQWTTDVAACPDAGAGEAAALLGGGGWACVPFAGPFDAPFAAVTAIVPDGDRVNSDVLDLLREAGAVLRDVLHAEPGDDHEQSLRDQSWRDRSTGVLNAARFHELLEAANSRTDNGGTYVAHVAIANFVALGDRMGQAVADLVRNDVARALALQAATTDAIARAGDTTFGCILYGRRVGEVDFFLHAVADLVAAAARRRGTAAELRIGRQRLGLGATSDAAWEAAGAGAEVAR